MKNEAVRILRVNMQERARKEVAGETVVVDTMVDTVLKRKP